MKIKEQNTSRNIQNGVYDNIDNLVKQYQQGSEFAANELVAAFEPFLIKYVSILKTPHINLSNLDTRRFLRLFSCEEEFVNKIVKSRRSKETHKKAYNKSQDINKKVSTLETDEVYNELVVILLSLAKKYNKVKKNVNFCGYVSSTFKFEVYRLVNKAGKDPITFDDTINVDDIDEGYYYDKYNLLSDDVNYAMNDEELGVNWLMGLTCSDAFESLTYTERYILKLYYMDKHTDEEIGVITGVHRNTAREMRTQAIEKLKNSVKL